MLLLLSSCCAAFAAALIATPAVRAYARRAGLVVAPSSDRWHRRPTALFGGVGIFVGWVTGGLSVLLAAPELMGAARLAGVVFAATMMFCVGLVDDRVTLRPRTKFLLQVAAAAVLVTSGVVLVATPWTPVNVLVTLFWFVGVTNAVNLLDNMDGVTAGTSAVASLSLAVLFALAGAWVPAALCLAVTGAALGFLVFNFKPASIFMGDSGSLFLGAALAGFGALYTQTVASVAPIPILILGLILLPPILDTTLVTVTRTLHNRRVSHGGRDHTAHRLVAMGFSERATALLLYLLAGAGGLLAIALTEAEVVVQLWAGGAFIAGVFLFVAYLGRMYRYEPRHDDVARRRNVVLRSLLYKQRGPELLLDILLFALAYSGAFLVYHEGHISAGSTALLNSTIALVVASKLCAFQVARVYRSAWDHVSVPDMHRLIKAAVLGSLITTVILFLLFRATNIPRAVLLLDGIFAAGLVLGVRLSFRSLDQLHERLRRREGTRTLIYGTGSTAELALRALQLTPSLGLVPVGVVAGDERLHDRMIHGVPVVHGLERLEAVIDALQAEVVLVGEVQLAPAEVESLSRIASLGIRVRSLGVSVRDVELEPTESEQLSGVPDVLARLQVARSSADEPRVQLSRATG